MNQYQRDVSAWWTALCIVLALGLSTAAHAQREDPADPVDGLLVHLNADPSRIQSEVRLTDLRRGFVSVQATVEFNNHPRRKRWEAEIVLSNAQGTVAGGSAVIRDRPEVEMDLGVAVQAIPALVDRMLGDDSGGTVDLDEVQVTGDPGEIAPLKFGILSWWEKVTGISFGTSSSDHDLAGGEMILHLNVWGTDDSGMDNRVASTARIVLGHADGLGVRPVLSGEVWAKNASGESLTAVAGVLGPHDPLSPGFSPLILEDAGGAGPFGSAQILIRVGDVRGMSGSWARNEGTYTVEGVARRLGPLGKSTDAPIIDVGPVD